MLEHILTLLVVLVLIGLVVHMALDGLSVVIYVLTFVGGLIWLALSYIYSLLIRFLFPRKWKKMQESHAKKTSVNTDDWADDDEYIDGENRLHEMSGRG